MLVIPAIYLKDGLCVRPTKAQSDSFDVLSEDLSDLAGRWMDRGAKRLQIIDLDGAQKGRLVHQELISSVAQRFPNFALQVGGGVRALADVEAYLSAGVAHVIVGTQAVMDAEFIEEACAFRPDKLILALDVADDRLMVEGRQREAKIDINDLLATCNGLDLAGILFNDLARENQGQGIDLRKMMNVVEATTLPVLLSGGISALDDIKALAAQAFKGIEGAIVDQSIYDGSLDLLEAQHYCDNAHRFTM